MRVVLVIAVLLGAAYAAPKRLAPLEPATGTVVKNEYIVVFNERVTDDQVERHHRALSTIMARYNDTQRVMHRYHIGKFRGYSANLNAQTLETVRENPEVKYVDYNQVAKAYRQEACVEQRVEDGLWGLARTSERNLPTGSYIYTYSDNEQGEGVDVYILDTGVDTTISDFEGRAKFIPGGDFINEPSYPNGQDGNGHGTHVAGTVMSKTYGLAKKATAIAVKVLNSFGSGAWDEVIGGVNFVARQHQRGKKSVVNMSLGGGRHTALNEAVTAAVDEGVHFSIAAGNSNFDACQFSPASADRVITIASSDKTDTRSSFSNIGTCVDVIAPGSNVLSLQPGGGTAVYSGTSMAAPHAAGVMAKILTNEDLDPAEMEQRIRTMASEDKISNPGTGTPNRLLYMGCSD